MAEQVEIDIVANDKTSGIIQGIFQGIGQSLANFAMQIPGAIMNFGASIMNEAMEAENGLAQLEAVIKSTGGAAGMTSDELVKMADELSKVTRFSDDAIIGGENLLLTFTNIGADVFPDATKAILDMSTAMNQDLKSSAIQLGKALNDPIDGVGALTRVGVQFTDEQKKMIESLVKMGDIAGAQRIILAELNKEFGGSAEAAGQTFAGQLDILKNNLDNVKESVGMALLPVLNELMQKYLPVIIPMIENMGAKLAEWIPQLGPVIDRIINVGTAIYEFLQPAFTAIGEWWATNGVDLIFRATTFFDSMWRGMWQIIDAIAPFIQGALQSMADWWQTNGPTIIEWAGQIWTAISDGVSRIWTEFIQPFVEENLPKLQAWWVENSPLIMEAVGKLVDVFATAFPIIIDMIIALEPVLSGLLQIIMDVVSFVLQVIDGDWAGAWESAKNIVVTIATSIGEAIYNLSGVIVEALGFEKNNPLEVWKANWDQAVEIVASVVRIIIDKVQGMMSDLSSIMSGLGVDLSVGGDSGQRAAGGPVMAGGSYLVGEQGAEIFHPSRSGSIIPNAGGGGGINITLQYSPSVALGNQYEAENVLLPFILQGIRAAQANGLVPVGG